MYENYEWSFIYILMIKQWYSTNNLKKPNRFDDQKSEIQWINRKTSMNNCKQIMRYFAEIFFFNITIKQKKTINRSNVCLW